MDNQKFWNEPNLSLTKAKQQHFVPRLFLRAFAVDGKVRVFDIDEGKEFRLSIEKVARESHFYDIEIDGNHVSTEGWLSQLEGEATPVMNKLLVNPDNLLSLSAIEELSLARFLVAQLFRTPSFRTYTDNLSTSFLQQIKEMSKKQIYHQHNKEKADVIWEELEKQPDHWWLSEPEPQQPATTTNFMLGETQGFANILRAAPWRIGLAPDTIKLYTSDNPVASYLRPVRPWWELARFAALDYFVPLSPKVLLKIEHRPYRTESEEHKPSGERRHSDFSEWEISFARHVVSNNARRYLYGEGPLISKDWAASWLKRYRKGSLEFAMSFLGFDPRPPKVSPNSSNEH